VDGILRDHGRLSGIVHSAGVIADALLVNKSAEQFRGVLAPKVQGTTWLDEATKDLALDFMLLFSSIAGSLGNVGQADYAAANGYLDAFAQWRNEQVAAGLRRGMTLSIGWPLWADGGMAVDDATRTLLRTTTGMEALPTAEGLRVLRQALAQVS
jgi:polyketide synthase PksN